MKTLADLSASLRGARSTGRHTHIFVVDDDVEFAQLASTLLLTEGYQVTSFTDPLAAFEEFQRSMLRPALLICDAKMRPINGLELAQRCRQKHPSLRVMLISGFMLEPRDEHHPAVDRFLAKPFLAETYLAAVAGVLAGFPAPNMACPPPARVDTRPVVS